MNQTASMNLFDDLHKWDDSTQKSGPQLESEVCKLTNEWNS